MDLIRMLSQNIIMESKSRYDLNKVILTPLDQKIIIELLMANEMGDKDITNLLNKYYDTDETDGIRVK